MSDQDVLSQVNVGNQDPLNANPTPTSAETTATTLTGEYGELIGADKKYKTVADALNSIPHAQNHISQLESEMAELKEELNKRAAAEEILQRIEASREGGETNQPDLDADAIAQLVQKTVHNIDIDKVRQKNQNTVNQKLIEVYGDHAVETVAKKAKELGLSQQQLKDMAAQSPDAFYRVMDMTGTSNTEGGMNMNSSVNTDRSAPIPQTGPKEGSYSWWKAQHKEKGDSWFYSTKVQEQYHQSAINARDKGEAW